MRDLQPWIGERPYTTPPELPGYRLVSREHLDIGKISLIGTLLIPVWAIVLIATVAALGGPTDYETTFTFSNLVLFILAMLVVIVVHEAIHGLAAALLGAKPSFGLGPGFAYTTFREPMSKLRYLIVGLSPLVVITAATVAAAVIWPEIAGWMIVIGTINASGAIGDLWMAARILRAPKNALFFDLADGFAVFVPDAA